MDILNINFDKYLDDIKEAFTEVLGEYYEDIINERMARTQVVYYTNYEAMDIYYDDLCKTKMRELSLKFFHKFGIDTSSYSNKKISEKFPEDLNEVVHNLIGFKPFESNIYDGIRSFLDDANPNDEKIVSERIKLLNYLRNSKDITSDNYKEFILTDEYQQLNARIKEYLSYYQELKQEYAEYLKTISSYKEYLDECSNRKEKLLDECKKKMLKDIEYSIPSYVKNYVMGYRISRDPLTSMFEGDELGAQFYIEYFGDKYEAELKSEDKSEAEKNIIKEMRLIYFNNLGVDCDPYNPDDYDHVIQNSMVRMLIPSQELISEVKKYRELRYEEARFRFYTECEEFKHQFDKIPFDESVIDALYSRIKDNTVCVTEANDDLGFLRFLFFAIKPHTLGKIDFMFLHELVHAIESYSMNGEHNCGFEILNGKSEKSKVNPKYRKYERLNETFTDILAIEVREKLVAKGIYIAEDEREWIRGVYNFNTHSILKKMVKPLFENFRDIIIHARLSGDMDAIYYIMGQDNFEELNYLVSHVDYLIGEGLISKLDHNLDDDPLVIEYKTDMEKLDKLYDRVAKLNEVPSL